MTQVIELGGEGLSKLLDKKIKVTDPSEDRAIWGTLVAVRAERKFATELTLAGYGKLHVWQEADVTEIKNE